jgi:hypothetical protein
VRGPWAHAQLIGGEVSLLAPEDHAAALETMRRHGRHPMSMSHGDFDYDYLERVAVDAAGRRRFRRIAFAGHDLTVRDAYLDAFRGIDLRGPQPLTAPRVARALFKRPRAVALALSWATRFVRRAGIVPLARHAARPLTFVVHEFMDGETVRRAWAAM